MRRLIASLLTACVLSTAWGQAGNDLCTNAAFIDLPSQPPCPSEAAVVRQIDGSNAGATASSPIIRLRSADNSAVLNNAIADVWYRFAAPADHIRLRLQSDQLQRPTLALFRGDSCGEQMPIALSRAEAGAGECVLLAKLEPGATYWLVAGGNDLNDQGDFRLSVRTYNDCSTCGQRRGLIEASPAPVNGTYEAGQTVNFCFQQSMWDPGLVLEWLHGLELEFGNGWDLSSLQPQVPEACAGDIGEWGYYAEWQSCNTGELFGPGFAFDARQGLLCGNATPLDGDPGNNFGDGPCPGLQAAPIPLQFCWSISVKENVAADASLNLSVRSLGDGYSGSWMPYDCNDQAVSPFLATAVPDALLLPNFTIINPPCPNTCDGAIALNGSNSPAYTLLDADGNALYTSGGNTVDTLTNLCGGLYELLITDGSNTQSASLELPEQDLPEGEASYTAPCTEGGDFQLMATLSAPNPAALYDWAGPDGFSSDSPNPSVSEAGIYDLQIEIDGCVLPLLEIDVQDQLPEVSCSATTEEIVFEWPAHPQDTAYEAAVLSGPSGSFLAERRYAVDGLGPGETVEAEIKALGTGPCPIRTVTASCTTLDCSLPSVSEDAVICSGSGTPLEVETAPSDSVQWSPAAGLSCTACPNPIAAPSSTTEYELAVTDSVGCTAVQEVTVYVEELPASLLPDTGLSFCTGERFEFCLPEENDYLWISPFGFITTGPCLRFPNATESLAGSYTIRVQLPDGCRFQETLELQSADCDDSNPLIGASGFDQEAAFQTVRIFPNPTQEVLNVVCPEEGAKTVLLYGASGRLLHCWAMRGASKSWGVEHLPDGLYVVEIQLADGRRERQRVLVVPY
jgi:hypothetical protein